FIFVALYVLSSRSRGVLLAMGVWIPLQILIQQNKQARKTTILGSVILLIFIFSLIFPEYIQKLIARGVSHRLVIWEHTLPLLWNKPLIGHGINFQFLNSPVQTEFIHT